MVVKNPSLHINTRSSHFLSFRSSQTTSIINTEALDKITPCHVYFMLMEFSLSVATQKTKLILVLWCWNKTIPCSLCWEHLQWAGWEKLQVVIILCFMRFFSYYSMSRHDDGSCIYLNQQSNKFGDLLGPQVYL